MSVDEDDADEGSGGPGVARPAAYGGPGWSPRESDHAEEIGSLWEGFRVSSEFDALEAVLLSPPGPALAAAEDAPDASQLLAAVDLGRAAEEHAQLAEAYRTAGVRVEVVPASETHANAMFCADLFAMTPQGAILGRPASTVRAGEERPVAAALAALGVPILATLTGGAVFEGADLMWVDPETALIARGLRTNDDAIDQIERVLDQMEVALTPVDLPVGTMHLMGVLRIVSPGIAVAWPKRTPYRAVQLLEDFGFRVAMVPEDLDQAEIATGLNVVTLSPGRILMGSGCPGMRAFWERIGVEPIETPVDELRKAAGAVGCLTGILARS
ncbi:MAG: dimethylarginine dimethylaminohydrolase family protein [Pikeienuella sp.]